MDSIIKRMHMAESELASMKHKLSICEEKLKAKDEFIAELKKKLEDKADSMQEISKTSRRNNRSIEQLENHCKQLEKQIAEMEKFLADYGLKWIGEDESKHNGSEMFDLNYKNNNTFRETQSFDFDVLMKNATILNELAGDGALHITHTSQGAIFKSPERVPLTFYANGFLFSSGPFCEYSEPRAQLFIGDLMDGFFPSELQLVYPDGVIFEVKDKRCHFYENEKEVWKPFTGKGFRLGSRK